MIDWTQLVFNLIWIFGLATVLSAAGKQLADRVTFTRSWAALLNSALFWFGLAISAIGFWGVSQSGLEQAVWILIAGFGLYFFWDAFTSKMGS